jgi:ferredoxin-NADP reductase
VAGTAVLGGLRWLVATVTELRDETTTARTIVLDVPGWPGHQAGQHVDLRLTAEDGYSTERSYSIASASHGEHIELTVQVVPDGEVSPYLGRVLAVGYQIELRGPVGGWFVWPATSSPNPTVLYAGGSGIVPLMAMVRARALLGSAVPFRLVYSARRPEDVIYGDELAGYAATDPGFTVSYVYTREAPADSSRRPGRIDESTVSHAEFGRDSDVFVCGPNPFVETVTRLLGKAKHDPRRIRTERFGSQGGTS